MKIDILCTFHAYTKVCGLSLGRVNKVFDVIVWNSALAVVGQKRLSETTIGNRKDCVCLHLHGQVSRQPKRCRSAMLDPMGQAF